MARKGQKYFLREIDIDKNLSGSAESLSISSCSNVPSEKGSKGDEFSASFVAQTNWTFVEKLLKVGNVEKVMKLKLFKFLTLLRNARPKRSEC